MKILIIKLSSFGDIIHSLPVLNAVKAAFPNVQADWLTSEKFEELLNEHPNIDNLYCLPKPIKGWGKLIKQLQTQNYDYILDLQGLMKSGLIARLIGAQNIVGLSPARERLCELFWTQKIKTSNILDSEVHVIERALQITKVFNLNPTETKVEFALKPKELEKLFLGKFLILAPETRWKSKNWPAKHWISLINKLLENSDFSVLILGEGSSRLNLPVSERLHDLRGKTNLQHLVSFIAQTELVVGGDSGIIHLASGMGRKTLGLFGPTSPKRTGPWQGNFLWTEPSCSPCHKRKCPLKGANYLQCLYDLKAETVFNKIQEILK